MNNYAIPQFTSISKAILYFIFVSCIVKLNFFGTNIVAILFSVFVPSLLGIIDTAVVVKKIQNFTKTGHKM